MQSNECIVPSAEKLEAELHEPSLLPQAFEPGCSAASGAEMSKLKFLEKGPHPSLVFYIKNA